MFTAATLPPIGPLSQRPAASAVDAVLNSTHQNIGSGLSSAAARLHPLPPGPFGGVLSRSGRRAPGGVLPTAAQEEYAVKHLPPAYFALVMATGIISIAAWNFELTALASGLFVLNGVAYALVFDLVETLRTQHVW